MKRKRSIPGVRLLLCALLAAALVGVTQRAEAATYSEPDSGIITISPQKVSDEGTCQAEWVQWKSNGADKKYFRTVGPRGTDRINGEEQCVDSNNKQSTEHIGALEFKNLSGTTGTLTIEYTYNHKNYSGKSWFNLWIFPQDTNGNNVAPAQCNGISPTYSGGAQDSTHLTAEVRINPNESAYLVAKVYDSPGSSSRAYVDVTIFSVSFVQEGKPVNVTFQAPETHRLTDSVGSYTVSYGNTNQSMAKDSEPHTAPIQSDTKVTLKATPTSGTETSVVFRDWYDVTNEETLSTSATFETYFSDNTTITARYIDLWTTPLFEVNGQTFTDLNAAVKYAQKIKYSTVRLVKSGGIYSGEYTIPNGVTLLLPYERDNKSIWNVNPDNWQSFPKKDAPDHVDCTDSKGAATDFESVKLTLKNTKLIVENGGAIEVGGMYGIRQGKHDGCFAPVWRYGWLFFEDSNSSITVKSGGKLYAWGYITGNGTVTAESGAELWELFQIMDWCGGTEATAKQSANVFPFTQYYVQNIEAELILKYGAKECVVAGLKADETIGKGKATLIGSDGLFRLGSGAELRRKYNTTTDRIEYTLSGDVSLAYINLSLMGYGLTVSSKDYVLPINGNTTVTIKDGATLNVTSDTSLLPGTQVYINAGGTLAVADTAHLYIYDRNEWMKKAYCYQGAYFQPVDFTPGKKRSGEASALTGVRTNDSLVDVIIDVNGTLKGNNIYTTGTTGTAEANGGANVCSSGGTGKYVREGAVGNGLLKQKAQDQTADVIDITPIKLKNGANASPVYTETGNTAVTYYYNKSSETWGTQQVVQVTLDYNYDGAKSETISSTQALPAPTRTGYKFTGWNTDPKGAGTPYEAGEVHSFTSDTTLYAQWEAKTYTLKLNDNYSSTNANKSTLTLTKVPGGTISQTSSGSLAFTVAYGDVIVLPKSTEFIKSNDGSTFLGWKPMWCKDGKTYSAEAEITISEGLVKNGSNDEIWIYAQWKREYYTVTAESRSFSTQDKWDEVPLNPSGKGGLVDANPMADVSLDGTGTYKLAETVTVVAPEKDGYTFKGWYCGYKWDSPKYRIYHFSDDLAVSISSKDLAEKCNILTEYNRNSTGHIRLVAVYTPKTETTNLTLTLNKAPSDVKVSGDDVSKGANTNTWSVPVGTEVTINVPTGTNFRYWTNANDRVMSRGSEYTFTMVTNTTLTAETSTSGASTPFVIFQSADGRLLKAEAYSDNLEFPDAPHRVGYTFKGWKVDGAADSAATTDLTELKTAIEAATTATIVPVYSSVSDSNLKVTVYVDGTKNEGMSKSNLSLGEIAMFTANQTANNKAFRFWASDVKGANILSFSTTYSFRVTQDTDIYAIYGETVTDRPPVVRVDNVLAKEENNVNSLTFMIGASIPEGYQLVEMGALYAKDLSASVNADEQLRVEKVGSDNSVYKAVSRLKHDATLTDYSYALGFKIPDNSNTTICLRGYVAVKKTGDSTIYYYYSGVHSANYNDFNTQQGG